MVNLSWKLVFFDDDKLIKTVERGNRKALSRMGAHIRQTAKQSIRSGGVGPSRPGRPPRNETGLLKKFIFFAYERTTQSVVVGPARTSRSSGAPELLEFGGSTIARANLNISKRTGRPTIKSKRSSYPIKKGQTIQIKPRPFMGPAYEKELIDAPNEWRGVMLEGAT